VRVSRASTALSGGPHASVEGCLGARGVHGTSHHLFLRLSTFQEPSNLARRSARLGTGRAIRVLHNCGSAPWVPTFTRPPALQIEASATDVLGAPRDHISEKIPPVVPGYWNSPFQLIFWVICIKLRFSDNRFA